MNALYIAQCTENDLDALAALNQQLIEDEQHDNSMSREELKERMRGFLRTDYKAYWFKEGEQIKGYALVNHHRSPLYLRQFFICRDTRRQGIGKSAFKLLVSHLECDCIDLEVLRANKRGYEFWKSLGFDERSIYMRLATETEMKE